jgi:hypothetical protein
MIKLAETGQQREQQPCDGMSVRTPAGRQLFTGR